MTPRQQQQQRTQRLSNSMDWQPTSRPHKIRSHRVPPVARRTGEGDKTSLTRAEMSGERKLTTAVSMAAAANRTRTCNAGLAHVTQEGVLHTSRLEDQPKTDTDTLDVFPLDQWTKGPQERLRGGRSERAGTGVRVTKEPASTDRQTGLEAQGKRTSPGQSSPVPVQSSPLRSSPNKRSRKVGSRDDQPQGARRTCTREYDDERRWRPRPGAQSIGTQAAASETPETLLQR